MFLAHFWYGYSQEANAYEHQNFQAKKTYRMEENLAKLTTDQKFTKFSLSKFLHIYSKILREYNSVSLTVL